MATLQIAHLSDLHILQDYYGSHLDRAPLAQPVPPAPYVAAGLREAAAARPDVIVLTGDLVHEGTEEDYRLLRRMVDRECQGIPVIPVLGNHDFKAAFYRGYLGREPEGLYTARYDINGYCLLVMGTARERCANGCIPEEEVRWLADALRENSREGTILLGHHPLASRQAWFHTDFPESFRRVVEESDVFAYLCGHAHYGEIRTVMGIQQITAESFAFGVETVSSTEVIYTETRGYNTCWIEGRDITVHAHQVFPFHPQICRLAF